jgi:AraC-like DNA-binding protein
MNVASAMVAGAELTLRRPIYSLRSYLGCFWAIETTSATRLRTLPDGCAAISVEVREGASPKCLIVGPCLTPTERVPAAGQILFGVRLRPGVAFSLTGVPVYKLADRRMRLAAILPDDDPPLEKRLAAMQTPDERFDALEQFLLPRMVGTQIDFRVQSALKRIEDCAGQMPIAELARACRVSPRHLNRLMRNWVGVSPKRLARFVRFQTLLERMEASPPNPARAAAELGYFDQAHLANEVAQFAGMSPGLVAAHRVADFSKTRCE